MKFFLLSLIIVIALTHTEGLAGTSKNMKPKEFSKISLEKSDYLDQLEFYIEKYEREGVDVSSSGLDLLCSNVKTEETRKYELCSRYNKAKNSKKSGSQTGESE